METGNGTLLEVLVQTQIGSFGWRLLGCDGTRTSQAVFLKSEHMALVHVLHLTTTRYHRNLTN